MNQEDHTSKLNKVDELMDTLQIRKELKGKLYYSYPNIFKDLFSLLSLFEQDEFFFSLLMHTGDRMYQDYPGDKNNMKINWWSDKNINYNLLIQEIFDDYWAFYVCFQHGFTKQAVEILRNTFELIINLYLMKFCKKEDDDEIVKWVYGEEGFKKMNKKIETVKKLDFLKSNNISDILMKIYNILCMATHSHKKMMTSLTVPGVIWIKDKMMFESFTVLQTRSIFLLVFEVELIMLKHFIMQDEKSPFTDKIIKTFCKAEDYLKKYAKTIDDIKKDFVLRKKNINLESGKGILFSLKINNEWTFKGKHVDSLSQEENKELKDKIENLLLCDSV